jgi:hypothetical protein
MRAWVWNFYYECKYFTGHTILYKYLISMVWTNVCFIISLHHMLAFGPHVGSLKYMQLVTIIRNVIQNTRIKLFYIDDPDSDKIFSGYQLCQLFRNYGRLRKHLCP